MAKCMKCGGMKYKTGGSTMKTTVGSASPKGLIFGIPNAGGTGPETMKKGGSTSRAVKHSCPPGTVRSATGGCVSQRPVPKAQMGAIVKTIKAIGKGASKLNEMRPMVKYKNYVPGGHGKKALLKQGAEMAIIGGAGTAAATKAVLSGAKKPVAKKKK